MHRLLLVEPTLVDILARRRPAAADSGRQRRDDHDNDDEPETDADDGDDQRQVVDGEGVVPGRRSAEAVACCVGLVQAVGVRNRRVDDDDQADGGRA
jgi:hypothetical protein